MIRSGRIPERWPAFLLAIALPFALPPSAAPAQQADPQLAAPRQHGAAVLEALRDKEIAAALKRFGEAADLSPSIDPSANDGLSAAAGGLYRTLMQLSSDERYDLLYAWSMPSETRPQVRILTTLVPQEAPPREFARALGERPRDTSFPVSEIGGIPGLFSTGWMLVQAADDVGRLRRLTSELERLTEQSTPNANVLLTLARLADRRGDTSAAADALQRRKAALEGRGAAPADPSSAVDPSNLALAAAALQHEELRPLGEEIFKFLADKALTKGSPRLRSFLRIAHAVAAQLAHGESGPEVLYANRLKYWVPASGKTAELSAGGGVGAMWLVHEDHILHLAGSGNDVLFLRYPLTGEFDFTCETQVGGDIGTEGGLVYGGLHFEALGRPEVLTLWDADFAYRVRRPCPFVRQEDRPTFNRVSIRSTAEGPVFAANLHPMWFDGAASQASPWLGLRSFGDRRPIFRNLKITGNPVIPREVRMSDGDELRGWQAGFFNETLPPLTGGRPSSELVFPVQPVGARREPDWTIQGGVIQADKRDLPQGATAQSLLRYQRPLLDGEAVSYEFHYQPGEYEVHPALGRLAFLVEPGGVRIHWITDGDFEWTGLPPDNATLEPLNRRGPRPLPLQENDWNKVTLARAGGKVTVSLNGELIYNRPVDYGGNLTFGLYRNAAVSAVRVRNVDMSGEWPESLPEELLQNPAAVAGAPPSTADRHARNDAVGEEQIAANVRRIRKEAARLAPAERFEFLSRWVLPGPDHPDFRVTAEFTPTDPSPLAVSLEPERFPSPRGGELVSPVFDLLDAAAELGKLEELRTRIASVSEPHDEFQRRAKAAFLLMIDLELDDDQAAAKATDTLHALAVGASPRRVEDMWPETLALHRGFQKSPPLPALRDLLATLYSKRTMRSVPPGCEIWHARIAYLMEQNRRLGERLDEPPEAAVPDDWISVRRLSSRPRADGYPHTLWRRRGSNEVHHLRGHHEDYLFFRSPLRGDFEVAGEMGIEATTQLFAAGRYFGPRWAREELEIGDFRQGSTIEMIAPPFGKFSPWVRFRAVVRDRVRTIHINGRPVHTQDLPEHHDPWFGVRAWSRAVARLRNVQVTGEPEVSDEVRMSASNEFIGWVPYYDESAGHKDAIWRRIEDSHGRGEIHGRHRPELKGSFCESLLGYHRPLAEDGAVEYEFLYEPGEFHAHPALDRLVFILAPERVRIHWLTDGRYDRTDVPPDNILDEPRNRRGPTPLPLRIGEWNHVRISITGDLASVELNDQLIYERELEPTNRRTFGLFHYADRTELRVRDVTMRGDWPKQIPPHGEQDLADPLVAALDADLPKLTSAFTHDFATGGLPEEYFKQMNWDGLARITPRGDGVHVVRPGGEWTSVAIRLPFSAVGDFDFEASFDQLHLQAEQHACIMLQAAVDDKQQHQCRVLRRADHRQDSQDVEAAITKLHPSGERIYSGEANSCEALSGTLRLARRGDEVHYLFAEHGSEIFQLVRTRTVSDAPLIQEGVDLSVVCNGAGETRVAWKSITLRAEQLKYLPPDAEPERALYIMDADGGGLRHLTGPAPGCTHLGSPEWSRDGSTIVFDMSRGPVATSHIAAIDIDGGAIRDLGPGCMPSFSRDGQQIVFSQPGQGVMTMNSDASERKTLDSAGWGAQWSPDGKDIAYAKSGNITLFNVDTQKERLLLTGEASTRYSYIYWNLGWSHDSRWIAFRARNRNTGEDEVAVAGADPDDRLQVLHTGEGNIHPDFTWSADNRRVLFAIHTPAIQASRLFWADRTAPGPPELLASQPSDLDILNCAWSSDGRHIAFTSESIPQPLSWP